MIVPKSATDRARHIAAKWKNRKSRHGRGREQRNNPRGGCARNGLRCEQHTPLSHGPVGETLLTFSSAGPISTPPGTSGLLALKWNGTMTGTTRSSGGLDDRRKRLLFRCWHRGTREMDLILGRFAEAEISGMRDDELAELERLIEVLDPDLYAALIGATPLDPEHATALFDRIKAFRVVDHDA